MRKRNYTLPNIKKFRNIILSYYRTHGRDFVWRRARDPYKIFVSEVMLQQTQAGPRTTAKYKEFLSAFPTWRALARASLPRVLKIWQGLGYNRRALYVKKSAEIVMQNFGGKLPRDVEALKTLPGIGHHTASAIAAFAFNIPVVFIETNIRSVFIHFFFPRRARVRDAEILPLVEATLPKTNRYSAGNRVSGGVRVWYWALMDYGAMLKKTCHNPSRRSAAYRKQSPFRGSHRALRGAVLRAFIMHPRRTPLMIARKFHVPVQKIKAVQEELKKEGFWEK